MEIGIAIIAICIIVIACLFARLVHNEKKIARNEQLNSKNL